MVKGVFRVGDENCIQKILIQENEVLKLAKLQDTEVLCSLEMAVLRLRDQSSHNTRILDEERLVKMVSWLSLSPFPIHHETISQSKTPNFGQWLLKHETYRDWCQTSSSSTLWLHGIMGSGKTYLCSVVVDSLLATAASQSGSTPFAYFYCLRTDSEPERSSIDGIITEAVVICALENREPCPSLLQALWQRNPSLVVTPLMMKAAKSIVELEFLLQRLGPAGGDCKTSLNLYLRMTRITAATLRHGQSCWLASSVTTRRSNSRR